MKLSIPSVFKKPWFWFFIILIVLVASLFYWQKQKKAREALETYQVSRKDLQKTVTASGKITAEREVTLRFQTTGRLEWVGVKKGDRVKKWQAIASLNQEELQKKLQQELLDYMNERWDFDETTTITYKDQALTETIRIAKEKAQFDLDRVVLDVEIANIAKKYAVLVAPIDGIVTEATDEQPGINVSLLNTQYKIVDPDSLRFTAEVEELDIGLVQEGQPATISLDAFPDETIKSQVGPIDFTATETVGGSTAYNIHFPLNQSINFHRLDMNGDVEIVIETKNNVFALPIEAVIVKEDGKEVTVLEDGQQTTKQITTGLETDDYYEIIEGLEENKIVVIPE